MRQLYSVFTFYQLMTAIQIKTKFYNDSEADIVISDHSKGYQEVAENLKKTKVFTNVFTAKSVDGMRVNTVSKKINRVLRIMTNNNKFALECSEIQDLKYDEFLFFNFNYFDSCLYYNLKKHNSKLICKRFEEGFTSCFKPDMFITGSCLQQLKVQNIFHNPDFTKDINCMYFYEPDLALFDDYKTVKIPAISSQDEEMKEVLNTVFNYDNLDLEMPQKYIFFEEAFCVDKKGIDDLELVQKIAEIVGKENIIVKLHPRNKVDRFTPLGIKTSGAISVPWEIVLLNNDFSDKVFMTISSGAVLAPRILLGQNIETYMMFHCTEKKSYLVTEDLFKFLTVFEKKFGETGFYIPADYNELADRLINKKA